MKTRKSVPTLTMFDYKSGNVTVSLTLLTQNEKPDGTCPVNWRVAYKGQRKLFQTGLFYSSDEWEALCNSKRGDKYKDVKTKLKRYFDNILVKAVDELVINNTFSMEALENKLKLGDGDNINDAYNAKIKSLFNENKVGNAEVYLTSLNAMVRYKYYRNLKTKADKDKFIERCKEYKHVSAGENVINVDATIYVHEITPKFLHDAEDFFLKIGLSYATIGRYIKNLRAIINNGNKPLLTGDSYPFGTEKNGKYTLPESGRKELGMTMEDIRKIENFESDDDSLMLARDVFMWLFYANGMNFGDMCRLRYSNIDRPSGEIIFQRKKTLNRGRKQQNIFVPILAPMQLIIGRIGNSNQNGYIFPFLDGIAPIDKNELKIKRTISLRLTLINEGLKKIAEQVEVDPKLSTSHARNSYISYLASELHMNDMFIKHMVGHSDRDVTAGYNTPKAHQRLEVNMKLIDKSKDYSGVIGLAKRTVTA